MSQIDYPATDQNLIKLLKKYHIGDGVTDDELDILLRFYTKTLEYIHNLDLADRSYHFAFREINHRFYELRDFKRTRDDMKKETGRTK